MAIPKYVQDKITLLQYDLDRAHRKAERLQTKLEKEQLEKDGLIEALQLLRDNDISLIRTHAIATEALDKIGL